MAAHSNPINADMLKICYHECTRSGGFIDFTKDVRTNGHYHIKLHDIITLFETSSTWEQIKKSSGHKVFKHQVTHIVVNIQAHKKSGGDQNVDPGAVVTLLNKVQIHLNILCNSIFRYKTNNWKFEPDYKKALTNYNKWKDSTE